MLSSLFRYKVWANAQMLEALAGIDGERHPEDLRKAIRTLNHTYVVDRIFAAHLSGTTHAYAATNTEQTPELAVLAGDIGASDQWYVDHARSQAPDRLGERIGFRFTDGKPGNMSRGEMLAHVLAHGAYHRGQVGTILAKLSLTPPADTIAGYLHGAEPSRRGSVAGQEDGQ